MIVRVFKFGKEEDDDMGFALDCLSSGLISFDQLKEWLMFVIAHQDEYPTYFFDILDVKERRDLHEDEIIGHFIDWDPANQKELKALDGIGYKRWPDYESDYVSRKTALKCLEENPHIETRFRETFPFIKW